MTVVYVKKHLYDGLRNDWTSIEGVYTESREQYDMPSEYALITVLFIAVQLDGTLKHDAKTAFLVTDYRESIIAVCADVDTALRKYGDQPFGIAECILNSDTKTRVEK